MSDLVIVAFPDEATAFEARAALVKLQREYLIELGDAVVVVKDANGHIKLNQLINLTTTGAASGALWGTLIGFIFMAPLLGTALGAASGALGGKLSDVGINDKFMKEAAEALQPGTAGLFLLIRKMTTDKVLADLRGIGGTLMSGGRFSLLASMIGALIIQSVTTTMYALGVPAMASQAIKALVVLIVILLYSDVFRTGLNQVFEGKGARP